MKKFVAAAILFAATTAPAAAVEVTVNNVGSLFDESLSLPAQDTPGLGIAFQDFFEFTLPTRQDVTLSMTDSATGSERIIGGVISLNNWTSTGVVSPFIPMGSLIESAVITNQIGGQSASVNPDVLKAGNYFAEISGVSGLATLHIAVDSTVTAAPVPEASTWVMCLLGAALIGWGARNRRRVNYIV